MLNSMSSSMVPVGLHWWPPSTVKTGHLFLPFLPIVYNLTISCLFMQQLFIPQPLRYLGNFVEEPCWMEIHIDSIRQISFIHMNEIGSFWSVNYLTYFPVTYIRVKRSYPWSAYSLHWLERDSRRTTTGFSELSTRHHRYPAFTKCIRIYVYNFLSHRSFIP